MTSPASEPNLCRLEQIVGHAEACPEARCPFWEPGGAALGGRCGVEAVAALRQPEVAAWLLHLRRELEGAAHQADADDSWRLFVQALNKGKSD